MELTSPAGGLDIEYVVKSEIKDKSYIISLGNKVWYWHWMNWEDRRKNSSKGAIKSSVLGKLHLSISKWKC